MTDRKPYATDLSDDRWALIAPLLEDWRAQRAAATPPGCAEASHDLREIVNAIVYISRAGCAWHLLPHDFPPYQTVYYYFAARERDGTARQVHDLPRRKVRASAGRTPEPTTATTRRCPGPGTPVPRPRPAGGVPCHRCGAA